MSTTFKKRQAPEEKKPYATIDWKITDPKDPNYPDVRKITFGQEKPMPKGSKMIPINYGSEKILFQTPKMYAPFGVTLYTGDPKTSTKADPNETPKYTLTMSFRGYEVDKDHPEKSNDFGKFFSFLERFQQFFIHEADRRMKEKDSPWHPAKYKKNSKGTFADTDLDRLDETFSGIIIYPADPQYAPSARFALVVSAKRDDNGALLGSQVLTKVFRREGKTIELSDYTQIAKGNMVISMVQISGLWIAADKWGIMCRAQQIIYYPRKAVPDHLVIQTESDDEDGEREGEEEGGEGDDGADEGPPRKKQSRVTFMDDDEFYDDFSTTATATTTCTTSTS